MRWLGVVAAVSIVAAGTACTRDIGGTPTIASGVDPDAEILVTDDGFGIQLGDPFAPAAIEIFTEPQCEFCADLQFYFGTDIAEYLDDGELTVTYRFLTFLDRGSNGYSHMVSNAMFLAAEPDSGISAEDFQYFVEEVYWIVDPDEDEEWLAEVADEVDLPTEVVDAIADGDEGVDLEAMNEANENRLEQVNPGGGTPTVYDLNAEEVVDIEDYAWLDDLVESR